MAVFDAAWSAWPAPAKLNLFLQIVGRRADGYHLLQSVFRLLDWGDTVYLRPRPDGIVLRVGQTLPDMDEDNDLIVRAARLLRSTYGVAAGVELRVDKRIPAGGGFGGGSSDAATVLAALNVLWGLHRSVDELALLGLQLGADVPVFVHGHNVWAEGVGEQLTPLVLPAAAYLLVDPGVRMSTSAMFQSQDLTRDAAPMTIASFVSGSLSLPGNAFEPVLRRRESAVEAVFQTLSKVGNARLTGSGSGCFVEFGTRAAAERALAQLPDGLRAWVAEGAMRSPLLDALEAMKV